jgi:type IV secretory pathway TrbL component
MDIIDIITTTVIAGLQGVAESLGAISLLILAITAGIAWYREAGFSMVTSSGAGLGDVLALTLTFMLSIGIWMWVLMNQQEMANAALDAAITWGSAGAALSLDNMQHPSFLLTIGLKVAEPIAKFHDWADALRNVRLLFSPLDSTILMLILGSFLLLTVQVAMTLIEFNLALCFAAIAVPWGVWSVGRVLTEASLGWLLGTLVRVFIMCLLVGLSIPLFSDVMKVNPLGDGWMVWVANKFIPVTSTVQGVVLAASAAFFAVLVWVLPRRAGNLVGAGLGLSGADVAAGFAAAGRFTQIGRLAGAGYDAIRGKSRLLQETR